MNEPSERHIVVISGAAALADEAVRSIATDTLVFAADGGLDHALAAGVRPTLLIGDLDSVSDDALAWATGHAEVVRHPPDKDMTDTELALSVAAAREPDRITLIGGGDRLDHSIAAVGALGAPALGAIDRLDGWWDGRHLEVVHGPGARTLHVRADSIVSLLALHGRCGGVSVAGTRWTLDRVDLDPVVGRGVSNVALGETVDISVESGVLTVFDDPRAITPHPPGAPDR